MSDESDHPILDGLAEVAEPAPDPRLMAWARNALDAAAQRSLELEASKDEVLAEALDRLRPLEEPEREAMAQAALRALGAETAEGERAATHPPSPVSKMSSAESQGAVDAALAGAVSGVPGVEPQSSVKATRFVGRRTSKPAVPGAGSGSARIVPFPRRATAWGLGVAAAAAAAGLAAVALQGRSQTAPAVEWVRAPAAKQSLAATALVQLRIRTPLEDPTLFALVRGTVHKVPLPWEVVDGHAEVEAPAYVLTAGHVGDVDLVVASARTPPQGDALRSAARRRIRLEVPKYNVKDVVARGPTQMRSTGSLPLGAVTRVAADAIELRWTLQPAVEVRSSLWMCVLAETPDGRVAVQPGCQPTTAGLLDVRVNVAAVRSAIDASGSVVVVIGAGPPPPTPSAALSDSRAHRVVRLPVTWATAQ